MNGGRGGVEVREVAADAAGALPGGEVHVRYADVGRLAESVERFRRTLSDAEGARARRFLSARERTRYIVVRGWLRSLLGGYLDEEPGALEIVTGPYGKPMLAGASGPYGIRFNVSHSGGRALLAFARGREVGVDVERMGGGFSCGEISDRFFAPGEAACIRSFDGVRRREMFYRYWTLKEAFMKASGKGFSLPMHGFEVTHDPPRVVRVEGDPAEAARWRLEALSPGPGFAAALAVEG